MRFCQNFWTTFWVSFAFFKLKVFFQSPLETFLCTLRMCSTYLQGLPDLDICVSKKIVTPRHTNQIICQEKWKQSRFWKEETQNVVKRFWQYLIFLVETFFQRCLQNFLSVWRMCSRYLQGPPDLHLCVSKKSGTARHTNNKISTKKGAVKNFHKVHVLRNFWQFGPNINWRKVRKIVSNHRCVKSWGNVVWLLLKVR